jgi:hypothetical protein
MPEAGAARWTRWLLVSLAIVVADLATKAWVSAALAPGEVLEVTPFFNLVLMHNTGAAFSFLAGAGGWQRWFFTAITTIPIAIVVMPRRRQDEIPRPPPSRASRAEPRQPLGPAHPGHVVDFGRCTLRDTIGRRSTSPTRDHGRGGDPHLANSDGRTGGGAGGKS